MGLFLQKTNIIRDYREDLDDKRRFWPKEVWSKYANDLGDFADPKNLDAVYPFSNFAYQGIKLYFRNDVNLTYACTRLSNIPLRPSRPIRIQLLCNSSSHGNSNTSPRLPQPPRIPEKYQNSSWRNGIGNPLINHF
jgi:hypothetical protein